MAIEDKVKKTDIEKMITKKVEEVLESKQVSEEKVEMVEKPVLKLINDKVETILNKLLDDEVKFMYLQGIFSLHCDLTEDDLGRRYYAWYSDDSKWNIKSIIKHLKTSKAKITETNIKVPTIDFSKYSNKSEVMEYMAEEVYNCFKTYNDYAAEIFANKDIISYGIVKRILLCKHSLFLELKECIESCNYKDKSVVITIEKDYYTNNINKITVDTPTSHSQNY